MARFNIMKKSKHLFFFLIASGLVLALLKDSNISFLEKSEKITSLDQLGLTARNISFPNVSE